MAVSEKSPIFAADFRETEQMVGVAQLVRVPDCGSEGRGFESHLPPQAKEVHWASFLLDFCSVSGKYVVLQGKNIKP